MDSANNFPFLKVTACGEKTNILTKEIGDVVFETNSRRVAFVIFAFLGLIFDGRKLVSYCFV